MLWWARVVDSTESIKLLVLTIHIQAALIGAFWLILSAYVCNKVILQLIDLFLLSLSYAKYKYNILIGLYYYRIKE